MLPHDKGSFEDVTEKAIVELEHSKTHMAMLNDVALRLTKWIDLEASALKATREVYRLMGREEIVAMIDKRLVEVVNLVEELNECGENLAGDFVNIFRMLGASIYRESGENDNDNDLP